VEISHGAIITCSYVLYEFNKSNCQSKPVYSHSYTWQCFCINWNGTTVHLSIKYCDGSIFFFKISATTLYILKNMEERWRHKIFPLPSVFSMRLGSVSYFYMQKFASFGTVPGTGGPAWEPDIRKFFFGRNWFYDTTVMLYVSHFMVYISTFPDSTPHYVSCWYNVLK
jgi:hypothetical protein